MSVRVKCESVQILKTLFLKTKKLRQGNVLLGGGARRVEEDSVTSLFFLKKYREKLSRSGIAKALNILLDSLQNKVVLLAGNFEITC